MNGASGTEGSGRTVRHERIATEDPPPTGIPNPIHNADGADAAGYAGALVAGVRTYGWAAEAIIDALGEHWRTDGWVDFTLRRPLYAGERLVTTVTRSGLGESWDVSCSAFAADDPEGSPGRVVLDGTCGLGTAVWADELDPPEPRPGADPPEVRPGYTIDSVPIGEPLRPLVAHVSVDAARRLATDDLDVHHPRYTEAETPAISPYFIAARMSPLTRHNFTYGPTIHVRSQVQHLAEPTGGQDLTINAVIVDAYDRKDHWYQVLDGVVVGSTGGTLATLRHHTIFRPRGT